MSSFWNLSDGNSATDTGKEYEAPGGTIEPLPDGTSVLCSIEDASRETDRSGNTYGNIKWRVLKPEAYQNRVIFQKIWCFDDKPRSKDVKKDRDKALSMLAAIDANAGGKLAKAGREPDGDDLAMALVNKQMVISLGLWDMEGDDGKRMTGNWVRKVAPKDAPVSAGSAKPATRSGGGHSNRIVDDDFGDDVPFVSAASEFTYRRVI